MREGKEIVCGVEAHLLLLACAGREMGSRREERGASEGSERAAIYTIPQIRNRLTKILGVLLCIGIFGAAPRSNSSGPFF